MTIHDRLNRAERKTRGIAWVAIGLVLCVGAAGCGDSAVDKGVKVYPVSGTVTLPDGKPLESGRIIFVSKDGKNAVGTLGTNGAYTLTSGVSGDGAPPGEYKVKLEPDETKLKATNKFAKPGANLPFPGKYSDEESSQLTATIKAEDNKLNFKLDNAPSEAAQATLRGSKVRD